MTHDTRRTNRTAKELQPGQTPAPIIDACAHHRWPSQLELMEYMSEGWREFIGRPGAFPGGGVMAVIPVHKYQHPFGDTAPETWPEAGGPPGSDLETLTRQLLDADHIERVVLAHDAAITAPTMPNPRLALEVARAANDWSADRWAGRDPRIFCLAMVPNQLPEEAAQEIRRIASNPGFVGVVMGGNGLGKPFGHPAYHPIYRAAAECDLPVVLHAGGDATPDVITHTAGGGLPGVYAEYEVLRAQPVMTHLVSLIAQGAFDRFTGLRLIVAGAGIAWVPSLFWRFDTNYKTFRREVPWLGRSPTEVLWERIRVATWPLEQAPGPERLVRHMRAFGPVEEILCYASGYPYREMNSVATVSAGFPAEWHARVFYENAAGFYRWPSRAPAAPARPDASR
jgi:predicted TIM-barrel fold metal-dependent hydrolase